MRCSTCQFADGRHHVVCRGQGAEAFVGDLRAWSHASSLMERASNECLTKRVTMLQTLAEAFLSQTGFRPDECELVERIESNQVVWFFRKKVTAGEDMADLNNMLMKIISPPVPGLADEPTIVEKSDASPAMRPTCKPGPRTLMPSTRQVGYHEATGFNGQTASGPTFRKSTCSTGPVGRKRWASTKRMNTKSMFVLFS